MWNNVSFDNDALFSFSSRLTRYKMAGTRMWKEKRRNRIWRLSSINWQFVGRLLIYFSRDLLDSIRPRIFKKEKNGEIHSRSKRSLLPFITRHKSGRTVIESPRYFASLFLFVRPINFVPFNFVKSIHAWKVLFIYFLWIVCICIKKKYGITL